MKLPTNSVIATEKLVEYLLKKRLDDDKSAFLALAGYKVSNWEQLANDLRAQFLTLDAEFQKQTSHGEVYEIRGTLTGPNGATLRVVTIWMIETATAQTKFITLFPNKES